MSTLKIIDVSCNHCGATLQVDEKTRFVTCAYCHSRLSIQHSDSTVFTEVLEKIQEHTGQMADSLEMIKLQNELEQLDREWMMSREDLLVTRKGGGRSEPSAVGGVFSIIVGILGAGMMFTAGAHGAPPFFPLFGILFATLGIYQGLSIMWKSVRMQDVREGYERNRRDLIERIETEKQRQG